jgi:hypothetical protein
MRKLLVTGAAALFATLAIAAMPATANAGGISFGFGYGGYDDDWYDYDDGIVVEVPIVVEDDYDYDDDEDDSDAHTEWCEEHYQTYDEDTNLYFYAIGKQKECVSPFS